MFYNSKIMMQFTISLQLEEMRITKIGKKIDIFPAITSTTVANKTSF